MTTPVTRPVAAEDVGDPGVLDDAHASHSGPAGQRRRHVDRVDRGVAGQPQGTQQVADLQNRVPLQGLVGREQLALEVVGVGRGRGATELNHALGRAGHGDTTAPLESGGQSRLGLELAVETGGVLHQSGPGLGRPQLAEETRRVPGRAARELALFHQDDIGPPEARQVVRGRGPDHAAADDHDAGAVGQIALRRCRFHGRPFPRRPRLSLPASRRPGVARGRARRRSPRPARTSRAPTPRSRNRASSCRPEWRPTASSRTAT